MEQSPTELRSLDVSGRFTSEHQLTDAQMRAVLEVFFYLGHYKNSNVM